MECEIYVGLCCNKKKKQENHQPIRMLWLDVGKS